MLSTANKAFNLDDEAAIISGILNALDKESYSPMGNNHLTTPTQGTPSSTSFSLKFGGFEVNIAGVLLYDILAHGEMFNAHILQCFKLLVSIHTGG